MSGPPTRRAVLLGSLACWLRADAAQQVWDLFGAMASALSACNPQEFLTAFDQSMPGYQQLREDATALVREYEVQSSIDLKKNEGDDQKRSVEAEWLMILRPHDTGGCTNLHDTLATHRREQVLQCSLVKRGRKWKIEALAPVDFFAPPAG